MPKPAVAGLVAAACAVLAWQLLDARGHVLLGDFRAFYCGGAMILQGSNPYAAAPLLHCEQIPQPFGLYAAQGGVDLPAPFPGYALAIFALFALLPFPAAAFAWFILSLACTALACFFVSRLVDRAPFVVLTLLALGLSVSAIPYGELAPVIAAALGGGALALRRGDTSAVIAALAVVALLPHIALPIYIALFVWQRALRLPIVGLALALAALDLATGGPGLAFSYFTQVLPNHAASEIGFVAQYSVTWAAQGLGASDRVALIAGNLSFAVMVLLGVSVAGLLARRFRDPAFLMLIPVAFAVTGGSYIHYNEITLALPAALLIYSRANGLARACALFGIVLVALPWQWCVTQPALIVALVAGTVAIVIIVLERPTETALRAGLGAAIFCAICILLAWHYGPQAAPHASTAIFDPKLAEASWARYISDQISSSGVVWWVAKLPTWLGLLFIALGAALVATQKHEVHVVAIEHAQVFVR